MLKVSPTTQFKRDLKRYKHKPDVLSEMTTVVAILSQENELPVKYRDHSLVGNWSGYRECHVQNDVLLVYGVKPDRLLLVRLGSHSELF